MKEFLDEVTLALREHQGKNSFKFDIFKTRFEVLHIATRIQKQRFIDGYSFSGLALNKQSKIWLDIWRQGSILEVRLQCLWFLQQLDLEQLYAQRQLLWTMAEGLENWCESDYLSSLLAQLVEVYPDEMLDRLHLWNGHDNLWLRRQSVVPLFYYQSLRENYPPIDQVEALLTPLLSDSEHYVQKAVGWTLREALQVYPEQVYVFLDQHYDKLTSIAFTTVMEKAELQRKEQYKMLRRKARKRRSV